MLLSLLLCLQGAPAAASPPVAEPAPQQMIDAFHTAFGEHKARAVHAKGIMVEGEFTPAAAARAITKATLFAGGTIPALLRFSDFTGIPDIPDTEGAANPRGLAFKLTTPDGHTMDVVTHSFNGFPTASTEEFRQLLVAIGHSGADAPKPTPVDQFLASHPVAKAFLTTQKPAPVSYGTLSYFGVNAFRFTDAKGQQRPIRYRLVPVGGEAFLTKPQLAAMGPNYLSEELPTRLARGPIVYDWYAQVAGSGDVIDNPSIAWPESRTLVKLGTIRILRMVTNPAQADKTTLFLPASVPAGIEPADPMLLTRQGAYPISFSHRQ